MNLNHDRNQNMGGGQEYFSMHRPQAISTPSMPFAGEEEVPADVDEPPDSHIQDQADFHKATFRPQNIERSESLLTRALKSPDHETQKPDIHITTDLTRRRSMMSTISMASTAELTSDGGFTSPARTNTPSPPIPNSYTSYAPFAISRNLAHPPPTSATHIETSEPAIAEHKETLNMSPKAPVVPLEAPPRKRCISFACGAAKEPVAKPATAITTPKPIDVATPIAEAPKRACTIKFACPFKPTEKQTEKALEKSIEKPEQVQESKRIELPNTPPARRRIPSRSPSATRKLRPTQTTPRAHRDSMSTIRHASQSPVAIRARPKYLIADEKTLRDCEATRFHEFASEVPEEDDWISRDEAEPKARLTINDTLQKENAIRRLGSEAEEEAEEEDDDEFIDNGNDSENDSPDQYEDEDEDRGRFYDDEDDDTDGNETDNEAGFADSDDEDDTEDFAFWTPGRFNRTRAQPAEASTYRASAHRTASASSIDSLNDVGPIREIVKDQRKRRTRAIKIRPGTPELPDSTDFVCGTLDEDRPLEDAYVSCVKQREYAKHIACPQDIDPSFPTSDPEDEEDEVDIAAQTMESDEPVWMHGKFDDSDSERRRRSRRSPNQSPPLKRYHSPPPKQRLRSPPPKKRLHSPPPKQRHQSPPPRKLFGNQSPRRMRSPPPRSIHSPPASPMVSRKPVTFAPLGSRPGLTHTKSLPRTPNAFCRQYAANRAAAANGNLVDETIDAHVRGAIDIYKGLEQKRQRRKEKFYQKQCTKRKPNAERRPQPGKGAERMRELGLLMAGKTGTNDPYMLSA